MVAHDMISRQVERNDPFHSFIHSFSHLN